MMRISLCLTLSSTLMLSACGTAPVSERPREVVRTEYQYLKVPADLTKREVCPKLADLKGPPRDSYGAAIDAWLKCAAAMDALNERMGKIEALQQ